MSLTSEEKTLADTIYTRALARAAEAQGSTQSLAGVLHVPENTLLRWMSGRAQMPLQAFLKMIDLLGQYEKAGHDTTIGDANGDKLTFPMGQLLARCARCDGTEFTPTEPTSKLRFTTPLVCRACGERVVHGNLIAQLAKDAVYHSRAMTAARSRRQAEILKRSPKLRAMKEATGREQGAPTQDDENA